MISPEVTIFLLVWGGGNFPNKMAKYGNFETELERTKYQKKNFLQLICVKEDCFYPKKVLGMQFLHFWSISQRSKFWWKFPLKTWVFRYGPLFIFSLGVPDETKSCFLQME